MIVAELAEQRDVLFPRPSGDTMVHNALMVRPFVRSFGRRRLDGLEVLELRRWALSHPSHARYARALLSDAVLAGALTSNPMIGMRLPSVSRERSFQPELEDVDRLVSIADELGGEAFGAMVLAVAFSGMRSFQMASLDVPDVRSLGVPRRACVCAMKGEPGREVVVAAPCRERLSEVLSGRAYGPAFRPPRARRWSRSSLSRAWAPVQEAFGRPVRFHALRGFFATWLLDRGATPMDVAMTLHGHANARTLMRYYARPGAGAALDRIEVIGE